MRSATHRRFGPETENTRLTRSEATRPLPAATGGGEATAAAYPAHSELEHQSGDALATDPAPLLGQFGPDPRRSVGAPGGLVDLLDARLEHGIGGGATRRRAFQPGVLGPSSRVFVREFPVPRTPRGSCRQPERRHHAHANSLATDAAIGVQPVNEASHRPTWSQADEPTRYRRTRNDDLDRSYPASARCCSE